MFTEQVMFTKAPFKFKYEAVEWVYDGLAPMLLPDVLVRRKGIPLTLALVYCLLAQRLGVPTSLVCVNDAQAPSALEGRVWHTQCLQCCQSSAGSLGCQVRAADNAHACSMVVIACIVLHLQLIDSSMLLSCRSLALARPAT